MDEMTSADLLYDAGDAPSGSVIWKKLAAQVMANVLGQHYYSELYHQGKRVKFDNLPPAMAQRYKVTLTTPDLDASWQEYARSLDKADAPPPDKNLGKQFAQTVTLTCR